MTRAVRKGGQGSRKTVSGLPSAREGAAGRHQGRWTTRGEMTRQGGSRIKVHSGASACTV